MSQRSKPEVSPLRAGLVHTGLSLVAFGSFGACAAGLIQFTGDARDAGPSLQIALFDDAARPASLPLKTRLPDREAGLTLASATLDPVLEPDSPPGGQARVVRVSSTVSPDMIGEGSGDGEDEGPVAAIVRINGREIPPGMSLATVQTTSPQPTDAPVALARAPIAGLREQTEAGWLPVIAADGRLPAREYARPSRAAPDQPRVALVVGGLGINRRLTLQAIADLPADVTLSFSANSADLQSLINIARADGHEALIEVPMEPYEWGRYKAEPNTLATDAPPEQNLASLNATLARASGYFGVINYQGAKFATQTEAVTPVVEALKARGLAVIEDASLPRSVIGPAARQAGALYTQAVSVIDAETQASAIEAELAKLESEALANGSALGSGYAYPVTIDTIVDWIDRMESKGFALVPASALVLPAEPVAAPAAPLERSAALGLSLTDKAG